MTPLATVRNLTVTYRDGAASFLALKGIDLDIGSGERIAIIGESGSGKSTLALALAGLLPRSAVLGGSIDWPGFTGPPRNGADIGFVFQDPSASLDPVMSVGRQVAEVAAVHLGLGRSDALAAAATLFERVRLPDPTALLDAFPHQLSGGQKQRVGIAAAIAAKPRLLIADEPTSALDTIVQAEIIALIRTIAAETGMALLMITHDIALASGISETMVVLKDGAIVETGITECIVRHPAAPYTRALLAACLDVEGAPA